MNDVIGRYARLTIAAERFSRAGRPVPYPIMQEIQYIEATAQSRLNPRQISAAMQHVQHARAQILQQEHSLTHAQVAEQNRSDLERLSRSLTKDWFNRQEGLTPEQFVAVRDGKKITIPARKRLSKEQLDRLSIEHTKSLDPKGKGFTFKEWEERLDELADMDPARFHEKAKEYRADPHELRKAVKRWKVERLEVGLQRRREAREGEPKDHEIETESHQRKAQIVDAFAQSYKPSDRQHQRLFDDSDGVRRIIDEGEGQTGCVERSSDIAKAMVEVEARGDSDE